MGDNENLQWLLERQIAWIASADSKITVLGPLPIAMLAISLSQVTEKMSSVGLEDFPLIASSLALCISLYFAKATLTPRVKGPDNSIVFFGRIASQSPEDYTHNIRSLSAQDYSNDLIQQIHRNAVIADVKHRNIRRATWFLALAVPFWLFATAFGG